MCVKIADPKTTSKRIFRDPESGWLYLVTHRGDWRTVGFENPESGWAVGKTAKEATVGLEPVEIGTILEVVE